MSLYQFFFYHSSLFRYISIFGTLFNDISIKRKNSSGADTIQLLRIPIVYSPKKGYIVRKNEDPELNRKYKQTVPRMAFAMTGLNYAPERKLNTTQHHLSSYSQNKNKLNKFNTPVPYDLQFELYLTSRNQEDMNQMIEQIIPLFQPSYNVPTKLIYSETSLVHDIPYTLNSIGVDTILEGELQEEKFINWTMSFTCSAWFFPPIEQKNIIKTANVQVFSVSSNSTYDISNTEVYTANTYGNTDITYTIRPGLLGSGEPTTNSSASIPISQIGIDDDFGITVDITD